MYTHIRTSVDLLVYKVFVKNGVNKTNCDVPNFTPVIMKIVLSLFVVVHIWFMCENIVYYLYCLFAVKKVAAVVEEVVKKMLSL